MRFASQLDRPLVLFAAILSIFAVTHFIAFVPWVNINIGLNLLVLAMVIFGVGLLLSRQATTEAAQPSPAPDSDQVRLRIENWGAIIAGIVLLLIVAEINGYVLKLSDAPIPFSLHFQFGLWLGGILLFVWGISGEQAFAGFRLRGMTRETGFEIAFVVLLTLAALMMRVWEIGDGVHHFVDEMNFTNGLVRVWENPNLGLLQPLDPIATFPRLYTYLQLPFIELFGRNLVGLRMLTAVLGALGIPACYFLCRQLTDRKTALGATLLLLTFPPHLHFSRSAFNNIADPLFGALALAFLTRALWTGSRANYVWAGVMLGLTQYFYEGGRLVFPALFVGWIAFNLLFQRHRVHYPRLWRSLVVCLLCAVVVGGPIYYTLYGSNQPVGSRFSITEGRGTRWSELPPEQRDDRALELVRYAGVLMVAEPENVVWFYAGNTPTLLIFLTPFVTLGFAYAVRCWYKPDGVLLLVWVIVPTVVASLFLDQLAVTRIVVCFPALMLLGAIGIREVVERVFVRLTARQKRALIAGIVGVVCGIQFYYYFNIHMAVFMSQHSRFGPGQQAVIYAASLQDGTAVHLVEGQPLSEGVAKAIMRFMNDQNTVVTRIPNQIDDGYLAALSPEIPQAFAIAEGTVPPIFVEHLKTHFEVYQRIPIDTPWTKLENYALYRIPPRTSIEANPDVELLHERLESP